MALCSLKASERIKHRKESLVLTTTASTGFSGVHVGIQKKTELVLGRTQTSPGNERSQNDFQLAASFIHWECGPWNSSGQNTGGRSLSLLQGNLPHPGIEPRSPALQVDSLPAEPPGKPKNTGEGSLSLLQGTSPAQESNRVSCIAGGFFIN